MLRCQSFALRSGRNGLAFGWLMSRIRGKLSTSAGQSCQSFIRICHVGVQASKEDDSDDDMSDSDDDEEGNPVMHLRQVALSCGVNRVRAMPQQPGVIAAWGDNGQVSVRGNIIILQLANKFQLLFLSLCPHMVFMPNYGHEAA